MINKKGFTLVELLAVIVLLGAVMVLTIHAISSSAADTKDKIYETKKSNIESAAVMYGQDNYNKFNTETSITVKELAVGKYLNYDENSKVTDPRGKFESLNDCEVKIYKDTSKRKISATFDESKCK